MDIKKFKSTVGNLSASFMLSSGIGIALAYTRLYDLLHASPAVDLSSGMADPLFSSLSMAGSVGILFGTALGLAWAGASLVQKISENPSLMAKLDKIRSTEDSPPSHKL